MNKENAVLIAIIKNVVNGTSGDYCLNDIDIKKMLEASKKHSVFTTIFYTLKKVAFDAGIDFDFKILEKEFLYFLFQQTVQEQYARSLSYEFEKENVKFMLLKGAILRKLYPSPELRVSCDIDVLYDSIDEDKIKEIMSKNEFECTANSVEHMCFFKKPFLSVEMHHDLMGYYRDYGNYYKNIWERLEKIGDYQYKMNDEDFYIYQIAHTFKHFIESGCGIRYVLDIYVYINAKPNMNREYLDAELNKLGMLKFENEFRKLANAWFGKGEAQDEADEVLAESILSGAVYGTSESRMERNLLKSKSGFILKRIFPSFKHMSTLYPVLKIIPPLIIFFYPYRCVSALFKKRKKVSKELGTIGVISSKRLNETRALFERLGIDNPVIAEKA